MNENKEKIEIYQDGLGRYKARVQYEVEEYRLFSWMKPKKVKFDFYLYEYFQTIEEAQNKALKYLPSHQEKSKKWTLVRSIEA